MKRSQNFVTNALKPEKIGESRGAPRMAVWKCTFILTYIQINLLEGQICFFLR